MLPRSSVAIPISEAPVHFDIRRDPVVLNTARNPKHMGSTGEEPISGKLAENAEVVLTGKPGELTVRIPSYVIIVASYRHSVSTIIILSTK
jgi:hypothetical protein